MGDLRLRTERLELIAGNLELSNAELSDRKRFGKLLKARILNWPPPLNDEGYVEFSRDYFTEKPDDNGWGVWYYVLCEGEERTAIGNGGFKGKPSADGTVEIGYSILEEYQRRGYASEVVRVLLAWAFGRPEVKRVIAETLPELIPSIRVLEKNGFRFVGRGLEEGVIRYEILRKEFNKIQLNKK
ncbi:MAG TPA: GNAT family N-acetyltransferase [Thermodesulfobacteriota bacterium]|nr:GNAT family N-acetyltransferase [Thermodesulfobacteriota bacterium]